MSALRRRVGSHADAARLTQEALAERAGLSVRAISDLERGVNRTPHDDTLQLLVEALSLHPADRAVLLAATQQPSAARYWTDDCVAARSS